MSEKVYNLDSKTIVITGVFENYSRVELKKIIESNGGKASSSISKNTSFILAGSKMGPKKKLKAKELNINIIGEEEFIKKYASVSQNQQQTGASMPDSTGIPLWNVIADDVEKTNNIKEFKIVQTAINKFKFLIISEKELLEKEKNELLKATYNYLEPGLKIEFEKIKEFEKCYSGKVQHFFSEIREN